MACCSFGTMPVSFVSRSVKLNDFLTTKSSTCADWARFMNVYFSVILCVIKNTVSHNLYDNTITVWQPSNLV